MREKIQQQISYIKIEIDVQQKRLDSAVEELKNAVEKYNPTQIIAFVPNLVLKIEREQYRLNALEEKQKMFLDLISD